MIVSLVPAADPPAVDSVTPVKRVRTGIGGREGVIRRQGGVGVAAGEMTVPM